MSCAMICGEPNIWPIPTKKARLNTRSVTFAADTIHLKVVTLPIRSHLVENLLHDAYSIFLNDLKYLETGDSERGEGSEQSRTNNKKNVDGSRVENLEQQQHLPSVKKNCDMHKIEIKIVISSTHSYSVVEEININLDTNESYNLTIDSKFSCNFFSKHFY